MKTLFILSMLLFTSACSLHANTDRAKIKLPGDITIEANDSGSGGTRHCPPGQAKKGNC